jgi:hypothetical protein
MTGFIKVVFLIFIVRSVSVTGTKSYSDNGNISFGIKKKKKKKKKITITDCLPSAFVESIMQKISK